jgi:cell wall-associated NlpC family hydrolase
MALLAAFTQLGVPYRRNTSKPGQGFDCSGLTTYAWGEAGFVLQRQSTAQIRASAARDEMSAQAGDLVQYPGHVMMWLGVDRSIIHAPYTGRNVEVDAVSARHRVRFGDPTG